MPAQTKAGQTPAVHPPYNYNAFSQLVGRFVRVPRGKFSVAYRRLTSKQDTLKALTLVMANIGIELWFMVWLFTAFLVPLFTEDAKIGAGLITILAGIFVVESFRLINMLTLCLSTLAARDPVPVRPQRGTRIAFTTTIVPSKEPFAIVEKTLRHMLKVKHSGHMDVWLLDEGNDLAIKRACKKMGVRHFSRKGIDKWNAASGRFKAKTKHGNHNAWLDAHGKDYDFVISVDPDHAPLPNFAERLLGYFRDPDVAFVVGPQVYGNFDNFVTKGAESQAYIFQATIQRAGNAYDAAMFVGTNHAYRVSTWDQIGGFQDSITEDMLTSLVVHSTRNPKTGKFWKSVYTPDVVAVGEGPSSWTDFFSQQLRWSRGSNEIVLKNFFKIFGKLPWRARFHYGMIATYYPTVAISWAVGILVSMLYLVGGEAGPEISGKIWLALYTDVLAVQILLYAWLRKYNVSPHEERGTLGFAGMFFSMISAPIYATALLATVLRRKVSFVVTPKGDSTSPDTLKTFQRHIMWGGIITAFFVFSLFAGNSYPTVKVWAIMTFGLCMAPLIHWQITVWPETKKRIAHFFATALKFNRVRQEEQL